MADVSSSPFDCILFDLDDTLYSADIRINSHMRSNIEEFLVEKLGISRDAASQLRSELFLTYGSSFVGLKALGHDVHPDEYHRFVHGRLPYDKIQADPFLQEMLRSIPQRKILFTNSDRAHARKVLERLGVDEEMFKTIICFETLNPHLFGCSPSLPSGVEYGVVLKPSRRAMEIAIGIAGTDPCTTLFLDDCERNIAGGKALGLRTALVGKKGKSKEADYVVDVIRSLKSAIPEIWRLPGEDDHRHELQQLRHADVEPQLVVPTAAYVEA